VQVEQNALAEATAMAKMKDDHFELVVNIQRFTPEEVRVYLDGQAVIVAAKHETSDGFVTGNKTNEFFVSFHTKPFLSLVLTVPLSSFNRYLSSPDLIHPFSTSQTCFE